MTRRSVYYVAGWMNIKRIAYVWQYNQFVCNFECYSKRTKEEEEEKDEPHVRDSINLSLGNGYTIKRMLLCRTTPLRFVLRDEDDDPNRFDWTILHFFVYLSVEANNWLWLTLSAEEESFRLHNFAFHCHWPNDVVESRSSETGDQTGQEEEEVLGKETRTFTICCLCLMEPIKSRNGL